MNKGDQIVENYSIWTIGIFVLVTLYSWNTNREWRKELNNIDEIDSYEVKHTRLLRLLISISGSIFVCLTFIFAFVALALFGWVPLN